MNYIDEDKHNIELLYIELRVYLRDNCLENNCNLNKEDIDKIESILRQIKITEERLSKNIEVYEE